MNISASYPALRYLAAATVGAAISVLGLAIAGPECQEFEWFERSVLSPALNKTLSADLQPKQEELFNLACWLFCAQREVRGLPITLSAATISAVILFLSDLNKRPGLDQKTGEILPLN